MSRRIVNDCCAYEEYLQARGKLLGRGMFGAVYSLNERSDRVIKFSYDRCDAWAVYAKVCIDMADISDYLLKVHSFRDYHDDVDAEYSFYVASIERLVSLDMAPEHIHVLARAIDRATLIYADPELYISGEYLNVQHYRWYNSDYVPKALDAYYMIMNEHPELHSLLELLTQIYGQVRMHADGEGSELDLHLGNMMYRQSTDSLVITDPFASCSIRNNFDPDNKHHEREFKTITSDPELEQYRNIGRIRAKRAA